MSALKFSDGFVNNLEAWNKALEQTLAVQSYKKFLQVTSPFEPVVVENNPNLTGSNSRSQCHENCRIAESNGLGKKISGWKITNEFIYADLGVGRMRITHHSNLILPDGTLINPTRDDICSHHLFLRDDNRHFDFEKRIGYNDRMVFGDAFLVGRDSQRAIPRNKVFFVSGSEFDRDLIYEKFKVYLTQEEVFADMPKNLSKAERVKWITLKSTASFKK